MHFAHRICALAMLVMASLFFQLSLSAQARDTHAAKMKAEIQRLGTGKNARVRLQLRNGQRISGYVSDIKDTTFIVISDQGGVATEIEYADAKHPSKQVSRTAQYLIVAGVVVGIIAIVGWLHRGE